MHYVTRVNQPMAVKINTGSLGGARQRRRGYLIYGKKSLASASFLRFTRKIPAKCDAFSFPLTRLLSRLTFRPSQSILRYGLGRSGIKRRTLPRKRFFCARFMAGCAWDTFGCAGYRFPVGQPVYSSSPILLGRSGEELLTSKRSSIMQVAKALSVSFQNSELFLVDCDAQPFVPMKPIVEGMGLDWKTQYRKLQTGRFISTMVEMTIVAADGKTRQMTCLPLRKLTGWLMSIHPNKVKPELREGIIAYQNECDDALWAYWNQAWLGKEDVTPVKHLGGIFLDRHETQHLYLLMSRYFMMNLHKDRLRSASDALDSEPLKKVWGQLQEGIFSFTALDKRRAEIYGEYCALGMTGGYATRSKSECSSHHVVPPPPRIKKYL